MMDRDFTANDFEKRHKGSNEKEPPSGEVSARARPATPARNLNPFNSATSPEMRTFLSLADPIWNLWILPIFHLAPVLYLACMEAYAR